MHSIGKSERVTQNRIIKFFQDKLSYEYLGDWQEQERMLPYEENILLAYLVSQGYSKALSIKAIDKLRKACLNLSNGLYQANKEVYSLLRYGISVREELGDAKETVWLIDWKNKENNQFGIAEEVTVKVQNTKRPDIVLYVNGIALAVLELKNSRKGLEHGIYQNLENMEDEFIPKFFTTMQLVLAGNDSQGIEYGTIKTSSKYYLKWKEDIDQEFDYLIEKHLFCLCRKVRILELVQDFVIFDKGVKKLCRPNQYFGIKAAQTHVRTRQGGVLWHTQGSGKSLTMAWLTKWVKENVHDARVLIITDREELDDQIEKLFIGVDEQIYRTQSGKDLIDVLNRKEESLICSLVHKFGRHKEEGDVDSFIEELKNSLGSDFKAKGNIHVFVDECHRTQSGKLHEAMKMILPDALFIGFTGTPLLKADKQKTIEIFGPYIGNPYRFDEAVQDGVVLDLLYEARDVEQFVSDQKSIDDWFESETKGLTDIAKVELKKKWGNMQKVLGSKSRLEKIVYDIIKDFKLKPRLANGRGNAMLVSSSVYQACRYYELFQQAGFKECAIITSYQPTDYDIKGEVTGETPTEKLHKYEIYKSMLNGKSTDEFESEAKQQFIDEPAQMKLLIVVDKLLTGFDAPSATYLYIDKNMQDHGLFQAICRVNRVADETKNYGYIIDYKDLFHSLEKSISDYTSDAFDAYDASDVNGLLKDRKSELKERLETALESLRVLIEPVHPKTDYNLQKYFCGNTEQPEEIKATEEKRVILYKAVASLVGIYTDVANELHSFGYDAKQAEDIKKEVLYFQNLKEEIKVASGDKIDFKKFEGGMRQLMDMYLDANSSKLISDFENKTLVELIINLDKKVDKEAEEGKKSRQQAVAEAIENNVRKVINEEAQTNPKYYEKMSHLLDELIKERNEDVLEYQQYLERIKQLAEQVQSPSLGASYPTRINSPAKQALYDNLEQNEDLALLLDSAIQNNMLDDWRGNQQKERKLMQAINAVLNDPKKTVDLLELVKAQNEYKN